MAILNRIRQQDGQEEMTFIDHLEALRWHIIRSLLAVIIIAIVIFIKIDWVFENVIIGPLQNNFISYRAMCYLSHVLHLGETLCMPAIDIKLQTTTFSSQFMASITIAFMGGFIAAFPYVFWELWSFIKPALTEKEVSHARGSIFWVSFFFF